MCTGQLRKNALKYVKMQLAQLIKKTMETSRKKINNEGKEIVENSFDKHNWLDR